MTSRRRSAFLAASASVLAAAACDIVLPLGNTPCAGQCIDADASTDANVRNDAGGTDGTPLPDAGGGGGPADLDPDAGTPVCDGSTCECIGTFKKGNGCVRASALVTYGDAMCAIADGTVYCSGQDFTDSRLYDGPTVVPGLERDVARIAIGSNHGCAVTKSGGAKCWGNNKQGQLGYGRQDEYPQKAVDVVDLATGVRDVYVVYDKTSCAVTESGAAKCWGYNGNGALGSGQLDGGAYATSRPIDVAGLSAHVVRLGSGDSSVCAILEDGRMMCWGNDVGGTTYGPDRPGANWVPFAIDGLAPSVHVDFSTAALCALARAGDVSCLGNGGDYLFGRAGAPNSSKPVKMDVLPPASVAQLYVASSYACVVTTAGGVKCWGKRTPGGAIEPTPQSSLDVPTLGSGVARIAAAAEIACAVMLDGGVRCWGTDGYGQLGNGPPNANSADPVAVAGLPEPVYDLNVTQDHVCALTRGGHVWCWGYNISGIFSNSRDVHATPVPIPLRSK